MNHDTAVDHDRRAASDEVLAREPRLLQRSGHGVPDLAQQLELNGLDPAAHQLLMPHEGVGARVAQPTLPHSSGRRVDARDARYIGQEAQSQCAEVRQVDRPRDAVDVS